MKFYVDIVNIAKSFNATVLDDMERKTVAVKKGYWLYNNEVKKTIEIIRQNWDFYYEEGYNSETPNLNKLGNAYYVLFDDYTDIRYANRSYTCLLLNEAIELAKRKVGKITWIK